MIVNPSLPQAGRPPEDEPRWRHVRRRRLEDLRFEHDRYIDDTFLDRMDRLDDVGDPTLWSRDW